MSDAKRRLLSFLLVIVLFGVFMYTAIRVSDKEGEQGFSAKDTITLWYTDEVLTDYLNSIALAYYEDTDVHVDTKLVSGVEYLENINKACLTKDGAPDLYIIGNSSLEKAYLAGLAEEVKDKAGILTTEHFGQAALNAVTYNGKLIGYPMYFDTCCFVYNKTYMEGIARAEVEAIWEEEGLKQVFLDSVAGNTRAEENEINPEDAQPEEGADEEASEEEINPLYEYPIFVDEVSEHAKTLVPSTIADILNFSDKYDAPEGVETMLKWDVKDIFSNFFFVGNYINLGGKAGDDLSQIDIYNENAIQCLTIYQSLSQFFSIDAETSSYENIIREFIEGKTFFTMATTDVVEILEHAKATGEFPYEYGVTTIPDLSDELLTKGFSYTDAVVINGYGDKKEEANAFARYICDIHANSLYERTGKISACTDVYYENDAVNTILEEYATTVPMPKAIETYGLWIELEAAFTNVWKGDDPNLTLKTFSEKTMKQITGEEFTEEYIEVEEVNLLDPEETEEIPEGAEMADDTEAETL